MCGIYLTISVDSDQQQQPQNSPPEWLLRRGPDAWNAKKWIVNLHNDYKKSLSKDCDNDNDDDNHTVLDTGAGTSSCHQYYHSSVTSDTSVAIVTLYSSVLQMRERFVSQPIPIKGYHLNNDNRINTYHHQELAIPQQQDPLLLSQNRQQETETSPTQTSILQPCLSWNGEIYQIFNNKTNIIDDVYDSNISDTELVSNMLYEHVFYDDTGSNNTNEIDPFNRYDESTGSRTNIEIKQQQIAAVMGQIVNAEYAFCIVTQSCIYYGRDIFGRRSLLVYQQQQQQQNVTSNQLQSTTNRNTSNILWALGSVAEKSLMSSSLSAAALSNTMNWKEIEPGMVHVYVFHDNNDLNASNNTIKPVPIQTIFQPTIQTTTNSTIKNLGLLPAMIGPLSPSQEIVVLEQSHNLHCDDGDDKGTIQQQYCQQLHEVLLEAVRRRCCCSSNITDSSNGDIHDDKIMTKNVGILFSGGLDSVVIAGLALEANVSELTLLTVSFVDTIDTTTTTRTKASSTPAADATAAEQSYQELCQLYPHATIHFVHQVVSWEDVQNVENHIRTLSFPKTETVMDVNIATALWFAASTDTTNGTHHHQQQSTMNDSAFSPSPRILLSGLGADELMGGYGRHRNAYHRGGFTELQNELQMDIDRLWERNLGRDDRILSDTGKEVRFPFLDINVVQLIRTIPLQYIVDYTLGAGVGDKRILRLIAQHMCLTSASNAVKRAIQFGSRISHVSDKRRYGSRRKATTASNSNRNIS